MDKIIRDGHIHTPLCPHGEMNEKFEDYVYKALEEGLKEITFTEHLPLPDILNGVDNEFLKECALSDEATEEYIKKVNEIKARFKDRLKINLGFEVDYIDGMEDTVREKLNRYGEYIEDSILSVHFVKYKDNYYAIDGLNDFEYLLEELGSLEEVYNLYFNTVYKSITSDLGKYKPKRIGHITLVRKFAQKYPYEYKNIALFNKIVKEMKERDMEFDYNTAGLRKPLCKEIYPSGIFYEILVNNNIRKVYGSDSHTAKDVGTGF